jgi:hypothetical protein
LQLIKNKLFFYYEATGILPDSVFPLVRNTGFVKIFGPLQSGIPFGAIYWYRKAF